jgi:tyrosine-specific transport protein
METLNKNSKKLLAVVLFIAGNAIGASVLGLPIVMRAAGFIPACVACALMSIVMAGAQLLMAQIFIDSGANDLPGMFRSKLGPWGTAIFNLSYFTLFFCLLVAYWSGTRAILGIFPLSNVTFLASLCGVACCLMAGFKVAGPANTCLTYCIVISFLCLAARTFASSGGNLTETMEFGAAISALPIVVCSYCFHGAIPLICQQLGGDGKMIKKAVILGVLFPLIFNVSILFIGFRVLTSQDLAEGAKNGWPVFVALANKFSSQSFVTIGNLFSIFAILSSLIGVTTTVRGAMRDVCANCKISWIVEFAAILLMPLAVAFFCPGIFIKILEFSGGILSNLMVGILPIAVLIRERRMNWKHSLLFTVFLCIFLMEGAKLIVR